MPTGPIIIVEDDEDDIEIMQEVLKELKMPNQVIWFSNCIDAYEYLVKDSGQPFIIISDMNLPGLTGLEFKRDIDANKVLRKKSIPFVFLSTSTKKADIDEAYMKMTVQGFFKKPNTYDGTKTIMRLLMEYWKICKHPNSAP